MKNSDNPDSCNQKESNNRQKSSNYHILYSARMAYFSQDKIHYTRRQCYDTECFNNEKNIIKSVECWWWPSSETRNVTVHNDSTGKEHAPDKNTKNIGCARRSSAGHIHHDTINFVFLQILFPKSLLFLVKLLYSDSIIFVFPWRVKILHFFLYIHGISPRSYARLW